ncbi:MAG: SLBB domain-containing protein, partial [Cyanobacteria bacterium J06636_28]
PRLSHPPPSVDTDGFGGQLGRSPPANWLRICRRPATNLSPDTISVNVVGEVEEPGAIAVSANTTLNQAVLAAGGFNRRAQETIELIRLNSNGTVTRRSFDVDLAQGLDPDSNPIVQHNDIVVVDPSTAARLSDSLNTILSPFLQILPVINLGL